MEFERILLDLNGPVATLTLNRPEIHNAFDEVTIAELTLAFQHLSSDSAIRAVVLSGSGPSFCAGADLDWMRRIARYSREENLTDARNLRLMFEAVWGCPKATVARVNGPAFGGGAGLIAVCDVAVAVETAKFGFTEVRLGLAPAVISPFVVSKIGLGAARALFVTGDRITAQDALQIGLIQRVVPPEELDAAIAGAVDSILKSGPHAIGATKRLLRDIERKTPRESAALTEECIAHLRAGEEGQEGIRAFLEKRNPSFMGSPNS